MNESVEEIKKYTLDTIEVAKRVQSYVTTALVDYANSDASCTQHGIVLGVVSILVKCAKFANVTRVDLVNSVDIMYRQREGEDVSAQKRAMVAAMTPEFREACESMDQERWTGDPNAN